MPARDMPDLPPLWSPPPPMGHNGGPKLAPRRPGRPTVATPELRDRIFDALMDGAPMRVICRTAGMPSRETVRRWRHADVGFDRLFGWARHEGYVALAERVFDEVQRTLQARGIATARLIFNLRREQLARTFPHHFGGRDMKC